jgi:hypothetical protein
MAEAVTSVPTAYSWDEQSPEAVLLSDDFARSALAVNPHPEDADTRAVVFIWDAVRFASMGGSGSEAIVDHRLYEHGLKDVAGLGRVDDSELVAALERENRSHPFHEPEWYATLQHHILVLTQRTIEVVAADLSIVRVPGPTIHAVTVALAPEAIEVPDID